MSIPLTHASQTDPFTPVGGLPGWTRTMRRATRSHHTGQMVQAAAQYQTALRMARGFLLQGAEALPSSRPLTEDEADARVCAFVSSHRCLADLQADEGCSALAARTLAQAHMGLLRLVQAPPHTGALHRAAVWHCRDTHAALLAHWGEHGADPEIDRALRAGCLTLTSPVLRGTSVH